MEENLLKFGVGGQRKLIKKILEDKVIFMDIIPSLKPKYFTDKGLQKVIKIIVDRFENKNKHTTFNDLEFILKNTNGNDYEELKDTFIKIKKENEDGTETATNECIEYLKRCEMVDILKRGIESIKNGYNIDKAGRIISQINDIERMAEITSSNPIDLIDDVLTQSISEKIPTGIKELDEVMNGGLPKKSVGLLIAGTGVGKSTLSSIICCNAHQRGKKVLQIFFEDSKEDIARKHYAHLTGINTSKLNNLSNNSDYKQKILDKYNGLNKKDIILQRMPNGTTSVEDIISLLHKLEHTQNWKPDMILIDYLSCMQTTNNETIRMTNEFQTFERMTKKIETLATDFDCAVWICQQTNRNGADIDNAKKRTANIQGSFRIIQPCSVVLYLDRTMTDGNDYNLANLYLDKNRGGSNGEWKNIYLNNGDCQIDLSNTIKTKNNLEWIEK